MKYQRKQKDRKRHRRLLEWERFAVVEAYLNGEKIEALAAEFNIAKTTITKRARKAGAAARPMYFRPA